MTTINTFEDILEAMERNPALRDAMRRHLFTEELLQLPARISRLEELVAELASKLAELTEAFTRFVEQTNLALAQTNERLARLESDVTELKTDVTELKSDVTGLKSDVTELNTSVARLTRGQNRMSGQLNNLIGSDYERQAARVVLRRLKRHLNLDQPEIIRSTTVHDKLDFIYLLNRVAGAGIISDDEADDLDLADIIIRGEGPDETTVHAVVEVSITMHEEDIERASRRAAVLERATGGPTHAVVVAQSASPANLELAEQEKVVFFQISGWQE